MNNIDNNNYCNNILLFSTEFILRFLQIYKSEFRLYLLLFILLKHVNYEHNNNNKKGVLNENAHVTIIDFHIIYRCKQSPVYDRANIIFFVNIQYTVFSKCQHTNVDIRLLRSYTLK